MGEAVPGPVHSDGHQAVDSLNANKVLDSLGLEGHTAGVGRLEHGEVPFVRMAVPLGLVAGIWDPVLALGVVLDSPVEEDTGDAYHHEADNHDQSEILRRCLARHCGLAALAYRGHQIDPNREYPI